MQALSMTSFSIKFLLLNFQKCFRKRLVNGKTAIRNSKDPNSCSSMLIKSIHRLVQALTLVVHNFSKNLVDGQVTNFTFQARYCIFKLVNGVFICKWKACRRNREMNKSAPYKIKEHLRTHTG